MIRFLPGAALAGLLSVGLAGAAGHAQQPAHLSRLPLDVLNVRPPSDRVAGEPGTMRVTQAGCAGAPAAIDEGLRQRIVNIAAQEWAFFGFGVVDQTTIEPPRAPTAAASAPASSRGSGPGRRGRGRISASESARVASSIAGYWTVTAEGGWIIDQQNDQWNGRAGVGARWQSPWSAAFISWVMCESGLSDTTQFQRAVAHHRYIDQAIRARDTGDRRTAFVAYDAGEVPVSPGDLLCFGRRPAYVNLAERRRQLGEGARSHCDIVVTVDTERERILTIGGNVQSSVSLTVLPTTRAADGSLRPLDFSEIELDDNPYRGARLVFAHLKLRADPIDADALVQSPAVLALKRSGRQDVQQRLRNLIEFARVAGGGC